MGYGPWGLSFGQILVIIVVFAIFFRPRDHRRFDRMFDDFRQTTSKERETVEQTLDAFDEALETSEDRLARLEERIRVLERIVTDEHQHSKAKSLSEEIGKLQN